ncbi:MAG: PqqD family protein [Eubacterium sp.]|nr:PqqD family protein [Eubacterium sp.]
MKIRDGFILREVGGQPVVVAVGAASNYFNGMVRLNATSKFMFEKLQDGASEKELVKAVTEKYEVDDKTAKKDVKSFVETLVKPGIIEE